MRYFILVALLLSACASRTPETVLRPEKDYYVLVQLRQDDRQRFDYYMDPAYEIRDYGNDVEIWRGNTGIETIQGPCYLSIGPRR